MQWSLDLGDGKQGDLVEIPGFTNISPSDNNIEELIKSLCVITKGIFDTFEQRCAWVQRLNKDVHEFNDQILSKFPGE